MEKEQPKPQRSFNILVQADNHVNTYYVFTDYDLIDQYKTALLQGKGVLVWEKGVIDCSKVIGIVEQ